MSTDHHNDETDVQALTALKRFMEARNLKAGPLALRAGFSPSAIYNLTAGRARAPSAALLQKIAAAEGVTVADILAYAVEPETVSVGHVIIPTGRLIVARSTLKVAKPKTVDPAIGVDAAIVSGDGLHPVPDGWLILFTSEPGDPETLLGELCVVRLKGSAEAVVGTLRAGREPGSYDIQPWHGPTTQGAQVLTAHRVLALQPPGNPAS